MNIEDRRYVTWDGKFERPHLDDLATHDCMVCADGKLLSVQSLRRSVMEMGREPVLIFACESGNAAYEDEFDDGGGGVFTHFFLKVFKSNPAVTLRDLIRAINVEIVEAGYDQKCEVVCRAEFLDVAGLLPAPASREARAAINRSRDIDRKLAPTHDCPGIDGSDAERVLMLFDMCRTLSQETGRVDIGKFDEAAST